MRSNHWIYERTISNTLSNLILNSTSRTMVYKTARIRSLYQLTSAASCSSSKNFKLLRKASIIFAAKRPNFVYFRASSALFQSSKCAFLNFLESYV